MPIFPICILALIMMVTMPATAQVNERDQDLSKSGTGLPLPRFASLKTGEVNLRTGPGMRYPIEWVITRKGLPVEIIAEYEFWRQIRTPDGDEGWVHKAALSGKRACVVTGGVRSLREGEQVDSPPVARVEAGAMCQIISCSPSLCHVTFNDERGYMAKSDFWGVYKDEVIK